MKAAVNIEAIREFLEGDAVVLTSSLRLARQVTQAWVAQQLRTSPTGVVGEPAVFVVDAWLEQQWRKQVEAGLLPPRHLLGRQEERLLWQQIIEDDMASRDGFTLLQPSGAAERALQCRQQWLLHQGDLSVPSVRALFRHDSDCATFERWLDAFDSALAAGEWVTRADIYKALLTISPTTKQVLILFHVLQLPPLTLSVLQHLGAVSDYPPPAPAESPVSAHDFPEQSSELAYVAQWAAQRHRSEAGSTGIVLLNMKRDRPALEYCLRVAFDCLGARYDALPVNFSTGMPLGATPMYRDALAALAIGDAANDGSSAELPRETVLALLRSPFIATDSTPDSQSLLALRKAVTDLAQASLSASTLTHLVHVFAPNSALAQTLTWMQTDRSSRGSRLPSDWVGVIRERLRAWQWPARDGLDSIEFQQFDRLESSFDDLEALDDVAGEVSYSRVLRLWQSCLDDRVFQPKTDDNAVQVLGPREAVGLSLDALWICGLQSGVLPEPARLLPFIPASLQRELNMVEASAEAQRLAAASLLGSWQSTHSAVHASWHTHVDGIEVLPSTLAVPMSAGEDVNGQASSNTNNVLPETGPRMTEHWPPPADLEWLDDNRVELPADEAGNSPIGGGAALLANQSNCPFRAWIRHRVAPESITPTALGLTPAERGSIVHDALCTVWGHLESSAGLARCDEQARRTLVEDAVGEAIQQLEARAARRHCSVRQRVGFVCLDLEAQRVSKLLLGWLALEAKRTVPFTVEEREATHELTVANLTLRLRPDRVDRLEDGRRLVIDYKTGTVQRSHWLGERPTDPQLPLYAMLDPEVQGISFARVHHDSPEFASLGEALGLLKKESPLATQLGSSEAAMAQDWEQLTALWRDRITGLAEDFTAGDARVEPQPYACRFCELASVCRISETQLIPDDDAESEEGVFL